jgi:hypothetical protein
MTISDAARQAQKRRRRAPNNPDANRPAWCRCNPGRTHAKLAAREIGKAYVIAPHFVERRENKWTDFNDLHCAEGLGAGPAQLIGLEPIQRFRHGATTGGRKQGALD